ncbi:hypothetical protein BH11PSE9_BH11PSE9_21210 [soil metagenome]
MSELLRAQKAFADSLRDPARALSAGRWWAGDAALVEPRLAIYRANVAAAATKALAATYPVVQALVGEAFFGGVARAYLQARPSTSGDLFDFGQEFASFLQNFEHAQSLAYLPDLARLEWRAHRAYGALDAEAFDTASLSAVSPARQGDICFRWAAGTSLVVSPYPIVQLWRIHRPGFEGTFEVDWTRGEIACIAREGFDVVVSAITAADAAFIDASLAGGALGLSCEAALVVDQSFEPGPLLRRAIATRLITGFLLPANESVS